MQKKLIILVLGLSLLGCSSNQSDSVFDQLNAKKRHSIFNLTTLLTEEENDVSFPIWFDEEEIRKHHISKIIRSSFPINDQEKNPFVSIKGAIPREKRAYFFDLNGRITQMNVHYFYDDREIGSILFTYAGERDGKGYANVQKKVITKTDKRITETHELFDPEVRELEFRTFIKRKAKHKYLIYQDMETGKYLYYMLHPKNWGVLAVDSILNPNPKDLIVWGTPYFPSKKYQVTNKVNEFNVREFHYNSVQHKMIDFWIKKEFPFDYKRTFTFKKDGNCNGYIDSTFAGDEYVTRMISKFYFNANKLPHSIIHEKQNASNDKEYFSIETFQFEYRK